MKPTHTCDAHDHEVETELCREPVRRLTAEQCDAGIEVCGELYQDVFFADIPDEGEEEACMTPAARKFAMDGLVWAENRMRVWGAHLKGAGRVAA